MNGGNTEPQVADAQVPGRPDSASAARAFLMRLLDGWGVAEETIDDGVLHVDVQDDAAELPSPGPRSVSAPAGLPSTGLWIIRSVARDWGSENADGGKTVWFELQTM